MIPEQPSLEAELRSLHASALDEALLTRLAAAADGTLAVLGPEEIRLGELLRGSSPAKLPAELLANLEAIVRDVPFPVDPKIVAFPKASTAPRARRNRTTWAAAAAVAMVGAMVGAISALVVPAGKSPASLARQAAPTSPAATGTSAGNFTPAGFNRGLSEIHDEGVVWKSNSQPHSVVRVVYKDRITLKDANDRTFQVEQPRVEYMLVPAKTD